MNIRKILATIVLLAGTAFAQAGRFDGISQGLTSNNLYTSTPNAIVTVYAFPGASTSCAGGGCTVATTYTDNTASLACTVGSPLTRPASTSCVGVTDAGGNFGFWALPGKYQYCIQATGFGTTCTNVVVAADVTSSVTLPGNITVTGGANLTGATTAANLNTELDPSSCAISPAPTWCSGSEMGAWINAAYAALPSAGGMISLSAGSYTYTTPIVFATSQKPVTLRGKGVNATTLTFTPTTGVAITVDTGTANLSSELERFSLLGPGVGTSAIGVSWGGPTNNACVACRMTLVKVSNFGIGSEWLFSNAFLWVGDQISLYNNGQNLLSNVVIENNKCFGCTFALDVPGTTGTTANSIAISNSSDWYFYGCSMDNIQMAVSSNAQVHMFGGHMENPSQNSYNFFTTSGASLSFHGVDFLQDNLSTFPNGQFGSASSGTIQFYGGTTFSSVTLNQIVGISGTVSPVNIGLKVGGSTVNGVFGGTTTADILTTTATVQGSITSNGGFFTGNGTTVINALSTPTTMANTSANFGLLRVRDITSGGTAVFIIDPNTGVQLIGSSGITGLAAAQVTFGSSVWHLALSSGTTPRTLNWTIYE